MNPNDNSETPIGTVLPVKSGEPGWALKMAHGALNKGL